ncbi:ATP-binding protein [Phosphitispora sp. TUW77]|uniref:ATP-binding protein n=1 Tax=Phosphitispora sp. TUW77 TaxID=3152361 RepID=UPI003AB1B232
MPLVKVDPNFFNNDAQTNFAPETHANPGLDLTQTAMSATNILFEGIRGTGKTHILKMIRDENLKNFAKNRILPVYISLARLSEYESLDEAKFRTYLYTNIVRLAFETINLNRKVIEEAGNTLLLKKLRSDALILEFFTEMPFSEVLDSVKELFERLNKELLSSEIKVEKDKSKGFLGELGVKGLKTAGSYSDKEKIEYILQRLSHNNASRYIIEFFKGLHDILELNYSLLLLDEISGVSNKAQIEVFRLLKLIRASTETSEGTNFLYFNGSVYPPQSTNYASKSKGHEFDFIPGEDCSMEYLEMDVLYEEYESFFKYITERRLQTLHPESKGNILWLFEDEKIQLLAAFASNGLPRRYFEIVKTAYGEASKKFSAVTEIKKIDMVSISSAIQTIVDGQTLNESQLTNKDFYYLEKVIIPRISARNTGAETRNESREDEKKLPVHLFISTSRTDRQKLANLIYRGVIHNLSRTRKSRSTTVDDPKGILMMLDLAVAYNYRVFNIQKALDYFQNDLRENAKRGYLYYSDVTLD